MSRFGLLAFIFVSQLAFAATEPAALTPSLSATSVASNLPEKDSAKTLEVEAPTLKANPAPAKLSTLKESEIPVNLESAKKGGTSDSPWMRMFFGLVVVGILAAGATFYVRKMKRTKSTSSPATEIKVLTQHHLGPKKSLAIIRVAGESILVGITDQNINLLKSLSLLDEDIPEQVPTTFKSVFNEGQDSPSQVQAKATEAEDEFSISGIKDVVTARLKNMRTFQ
jgi:flagellar protein FliO/FliZ